MLRRRAFAWSVLPLLLAGCGGSSHHTSGSNNDTVGPQITLAWPARARDFGAPSAATAALISFPGAGANATNLTQVVARPDGAAMVTKSYQLGVALHPGNHLLRVDFLADASSTGTALATAMVNVKVASDGSISQTNGKPLGTIGYGSNVTSIALADGQTVEVGQTSDLVVTASTANGIVALAPGSTYLLLGAGTGTVRVNADYSVTGLTEGTAILTPMVDGVSGLKTSIQVLPAPLVSRTVSVQNSDLAYDSVRNRIWLAVGAGVANANSIQSLDPVAGSLGAPIVVGANPSVLAISDDSSTLYVGLQGAAQIRSIDLTTGSLGTPFSSFGGGYALGYAADIAVQPGHPGTIAVLEALSDDARNVGPIIFDGGVARTNAGSFSTGDRLLWGSESVVQAYGLGSFGNYYTFAVDASGATQTTYGTSLGSENGLVRYGNRAYSTSGAIFDAQTLSAIGTFPVSATAASGAQTYGPVVDASAQRAYFLELGGTQARILAFDTNTLLPTGTRRIANLDLSKGLSGGVQPRLVRIGSTGLAFRLSDQVVLLDDVSVL